MGSPASGLTDEMGGEIHATSDQGQGQGTIFTVTLIVARE